MLAELLTETGRLGQAEQILDLLKEQELEDVVTTAEPGSSAAIEPLKLSPAQQDAESALPDLEKKARVIEPCFENTLVTALDQALGIAAGAPLACFSQRNQANSPPDISLCHGPGSATS